MYVVVLVTLFHLESCRLEHFNGRKLLTTESVRTPLGAAEDRPHLVLHVSLYISTILTDNNNKHECSGCYTLEILDPQLCLKIRKNHVMNIETNHLPSTLQNTDMLRGKCLIANHALSHSHRCSKCMTRSFKNMVQAQKIMDGWLLFDVSVTDLDGLLHDVLRCHNKFKCLRIQEVPNVFCSAHRAFLRPTDLHSEQLSKKPALIHKFTISYIPVGVWPPKYQATNTHMEPMPVIPIHMTPNELQCNAGFWTTYNTVAFVVIKTERLKQLSCVVCLIQHTEVFFVYLSEDRISGYVWMRQAPSKVLQMCLKEHCTSLTYDEKRDQIERPDGLRPWTSFDAQGERRKNMLTLAEQTPHNVVIAENSFL